MKDHTKLTRREILATAAALGIQPCMLGQQPPADPGPPFVPSDPPNRPIGMGKGIHPGRVTWIHRPDVARWDGVTEKLAVTRSTGEWWDDANTDPRIVEGMVSKSLLGLTGRRNDKDAWTALFRHFNQTRNFGNTGYRSGEKLTIKVNFNNDRSNTRPWPSGRGMPSPQMVHSLLRQLVRFGGVPAKDIIVYDVTNDRHASDPVFLRVKKDPDLADVTFLVSKTRAGNGRFAPTPDQTDPIRFSNPKLGIAQVPTAVVEAKYRINLALFRPHNIAGITLTTKNNFGSIYWPAEDYWGPRPLHEYIRKTNPMGAYNPLVDIMGHRQLGGKNMLYLIDGLYAAEESEVNVVRYQSFGEKWTSSLFLSQDPVAIDSVGLDFLRNEPKAVAVRGNPDNFLHEAALAENPPSGTKYTPHGDRLSSLGVHEHWNNPVEKKYSRNLGRKEGIELIAL